MKDETTVPKAPSTPPPAPAAELLVYQVKAKPFLKLGGVKAYTGAKVNLTAAKADAINAASPGALDFLGSN